MAVTLAELHRSLPDDLIPYPVGQEVPRTAVSAVHISELPDPRQYLEGGELLLTTGLSAKPTASWFRSYLTRLQDAGVAAVALGLGPRFADVPPGFAQAARTVDLPLFTVPVDTPFLSISRRYWEVSAVSGRRSVADALAGHRALVEAAVQPNPEAAVIRRLAAAVGGWAAHLSPEGALLAVHPAPARRHARQLRDEVARLAVAGVHAAATLPVDDQVVLLHPLTERTGAVGDLTGYVAVGSAVTLRAEQRHLVLAGVAVLGAQLDRRREVAVARAAGRTPVLQLLLADEPAAARLLASLVAPAVLDDPHRPAAFVGGEADLAGLAEMLAADRRCLAVWSDGRALRCLLVADAPTTWLADLVRSRPALAGAVGPAIGWDALRKAFDVLVGRADSAEPGAVAELGVIDDSLVAYVDPGLIAAWAQRYLAPVVNHDRADLVPALAAYLRHSGGWEAAAREVGVHRHTLRARVSRIEELLGVDLRDVDVTAQAWLALRALGRA